MIISERNGRNLGVRVQIGISIGIHQIVSNRLVVIDENLSWSCLLKKNIYELQIYDLYELLTWSLFSSPKSCVVLGPGIAVFMQGPSGSPGIWLHVDKLTLLPIETYLISSFYIDLLKAFDKVNCFLFWKNFKI